MRFFLVLAGTAAFMLEHSALAHELTGCADPQVFTQCLSNQDIYLRTCKDQEFGCLCKWNTVRLQCWDNSCPNDPERATQAGLVQNYCAIADAFSSSSSSAAPQSTQLSASTSTASSSSATPSVSDSLGTKNTSSGSATFSPGTIFVLAVAGLVSGSFAFSF